MKILVSEDEPHIAKLIQFKLEGAGFQVKLAENGQRALEALGLEKYDLLILDLMMPICDGWQVLETLRSDSEAHPPVLLLTARSRQQDLSRAMELGVDQVLKKPFDPDELVLKVKEMVKE